MRNSVRALMLCLLCSCSTTTYAKWVEATDSIMGTRIHVEFWCEDEKLADELIAAVMTEMRAVDNQLSPYIETSELYAVNAHAAAAPVKISANFFELLEKSLYFSRVSNGAFDITFASVGYLYDYRQHKAPTEEQLKAKLPAINYHFIELDRANRSIHFSHADVRIDLGGIAKGYAVDRATEILQAAGISSAIVTAGGDSRILGDRRGTPWMIGIRHPRKKDEFAGRLPLQDTAISTSGDYERYYFDGEIRIHHIIDPTSGRSADQVESVSILAPMAVDSDALSTTVFVLGASKGLALINGMKGVDAIIIDGHSKMHYSDGLLRAD